MYGNERAVELSQTVGLTPKNLQVVSFDSEWKEIYLGTSRRDTFSAICPNKVPKATKFDLQYKSSKHASDTVVITSAKWCPMDNCTVLVLGCQFGMKLFDWDGSTQIFEYDFHDHGIGVDDRLVAGGMARGIAAVGPNFISVGIHTGTIILFEISTDAQNFICRVVDSQRSHVQPITDLASTTLSGAGQGEMKDILVSSDETGLINVWYLGTAGDGLVHKSKIDKWAKSGPVTTLSLWNKVGKGIVIAGFGSGHVRIMSLTTGTIIAEIAGHAGWITGMDLASASGLLITSAEDGYVRVWQLHQSGRLIGHKLSKAVQDSLITGVKFLDPKGTSFALATYDSDKVKIFSS